MEASSFASTPAVTECPGLADMVAMGFPADQSEVALRISDYDISRATQWLLSRPDNDADVGNAIQASDIEVNTEASFHMRAYKLVILVRQDLGMGVGKIAAQCCHAALGAYRSASSGSGLVEQRWTAMGEPTITLKVNDLEHMDSIAAQATAARLPTHSVTDAGRTQVEPGTRTVLAIGPADADIIDSVTGSLCLL